jgi:hypothetical protein
MPDAKKGQPNATSPTVELVGSAVSGWSATPYVHSCIAVLDQNVSPVSGCSTLTSWSLTYSEPLASTGRASTMREAKDFTCEL